ncbi:MAG: DUF3971 domain-containing protein [Candidatus Thioglobus sp.]|nr:MAG: DUF3971 domain-containing protein [Candidatus Thioglobus sp.]
MIKKTLSHGVKALKFSTWISVFVAFLIVLITAFFVTFPALLEGPIENQLSKISGLSVDLSKITFDFEQDGLVLKVHNIKISSLEQQVIASVDSLRWKINIFNFRDDVYHPSNINLNTLTIYPGVNKDQDKFSIQDIKQLASAKNLRMLGFFQSFSIQKTLIKHDQVFEIAPMVFTKNESNILLTVSDQRLDLDFPNALPSKVDISAIFSLTQISSEQSINIPLSINYHKLPVIEANLKFFVEQGDDMVEFLGKLSQIKTNEVAQYIPLQSLDSDTHAWIQRGFISGNLQDIELQFKKNLSKDAPVEMQFNAQLKESELLFNADWDNLKNLDASINTDGKKIVVTVNSAQLNDMQLNDIIVQILDMSQPELDVEVIGNINATSEKFIQFLRRAPLSSNINETLDQFTLTGKMTGKLKLVLPLDERVSILDIDLKLQDNQLTTLKGSAVVENFNSVLSLHHNKITSQGVGDIRGLPFNIRINPDNQDADIFSVELIHKESDFNLYIAKNTNRPWQVNVVSNSFEGELEVTQEESLFVVDILNFEMLSTGALEGDWDISPEDFPEDMYVKSQNVSIGAYQLPDMQVRLASQDDVLMINNLQLEGVGVNQELLNFNGAWHPGNKTSLKATAQGQKLSDFLNRLKINERTEGGEFEFDVRLFCQCAPWNMDFKNITGLIKMNVKQGVFTNKDPNLGRILSLLNIRSIAKRLRMDVSDLTDKGFVYDDIQVHLTIGQSLATIDHFELSSTSSKIQLTGQSDIIEKTYDLKARVRPAISDAIPIATYLAGGGLAGLGLWLADVALFKGKILDSIVDEMVEFKYKITGSWDDPIIK